MVQGIDPGAKQVLDVARRRARRRLLKKLAKDDTGFLRTIYNMGISNELFPLLIFIGIGAMTDFTPLLANPRILLFGAAGQCGIFVTLLLALALGFPHLAGDEHRRSSAPATARLRSTFPRSMRPQLLGPISVAAYSYMALVPIIQPPLMKMMTTEKERTTKMPAFKRNVISEQHQGCCSRSS